MNHFLSDAGLPTADAFANQLGITGIPNLTSNEIYNEDYDDDDHDEEAIGADVGEDMEEDLEPEAYEPSVGIKSEHQTPLVSKDSLHPEDKQRKTRIVKRMVERPKTVYERFPTFRPGKVLDFSELFKGFTVRKSRISKRPFNGTQSDSVSLMIPIFS